MQFPADEFPPFARDMADLIAAVNRIAEAMEKYVKLCDPGKIYVHELTAEEMDKGVVVVPKEKEANS
jgi:hypothetical protein